MYKIGVDIVKVARIEKSMKNKRFSSEVFTEKEMAHCRTAESFAGLFAAKEAYFKAVGTGIQRPLKSLEILHSAAGKPYFAAVENSDISISHDGEYAVAAVVLWKE